MDRLIKVISILLLLVGLASVYLFLNKENVPGQVVCTMDAKMCPDGSAVGRIGPKCEFAPCLENKVLSKVDFIRTGVITYNNPGQKPEALYLVYEEPGRPAIFKELIIDDKSICGDQTGGTVCMAISAPLGVSFGGKRVRVYGMDRGTAVLVQELRAVPEN